MSNRQITNAEYTQAIKAVTKKHECDYCHRDFDTERKCVIHILDKHIASQ